MRLVERLADTIPQLEVKVPADLITCIDAADRLKSLTHDIRGAEITWGEAGLRLMDAVSAPVVPMAQFRPYGKGPGKPRDSE